MCGIAGIYASDKIAENQLAKLDLALSKLAKRGPDAQGIWSCDHALLGHRRLSIIDTSANGNQPMEDASGRYVIVFNGEIFNYRSIRSRLNAKGYQFANETDTEVLLYAWIEWGESIVNELNGFFAFAIYDKHEQQLTLVRDRYGIKPLVYFHQDNTCFFASELKALMEFDIPAKIDKLSLNLYFQLTYIPPPHTIYVGIKKLRPGHLLRIKNGVIEEVEYYKIPYLEKTSHSSFEKAKQQVRETLTQSVIDRLVADVPLGTFLSGGIDSSIVSLIAAKEISDLSTFSIGYRDHPFFDETHYAELVAKKYHTNHHTFRLSNQDLLDHVAEVVDYIDEPFADSSALPLYLLSRLTKKHVTVALSGDGADEIFSGYNKHAAWQMAAQKGLKNGIFSAMSPLFKLAPQSRNSFFSNKFRQLNRYADSLKLKLNDRYWFLASFQQAAFRGQLLNSTYFEDLEGFTKNFLDFPDADLNRVLHHDVKLVLSGDMLPKVDMMSMANSLEVRVPFLDYRLVSLAFQLPATFKIKGADRKHVLKEAFRNELPPELYQRGKHGFEVPLLDWFKNQLAGELNHMVFNQELINSQGIFNWEVINGIKIKLFSNNPGDVSISIWQLYVFQKWWTQSMDQKSKS